MRSIVGIAMNTKHLLGLLIVGTVLVSGCVQEPKITEPSSVYTIDEVWEKKDTLANKTITVMGLAYNGVPQCTLIGCTEKEPCCNKCASSLYLVEKRPEDEEYFNQYGGKEHAIALEGIYEDRGFGCSGNDCEMECYPLEIGKWYNVTGALKVNVWGEKTDLSLEVEEFSSDEKIDGRVQPNSQKQEINPDTFIEISVDGGGMYGGIVPQRRNYTIKNDGEILISHWYAIHDGYTVTKTYSITRSEVEELARLIIDSGFFDMNDIYDCSEIDQKCKGAKSSNLIADPLTIEVKIGNSSKKVVVTVFRYYIEEDVIDYPKELDEIFDKVYEIIDGAEEFKENVSVADKIAFSSNRDGNSEIYLMDPDCSKVERLTYTDSDDYDPSWSPDGRKIVYACEGRGGICVMNADGTDMELIIRSDKGFTRPKWSPDGTEILFSTDELIAGIHLIAPDGKEKAFLGDGWNPAWSPDGSKIAFTYKKGIWVMNKDSTGRMELTDKEDFGAPSWTKDGGKILFSSNREGPYAFYLINPDGGQLTKINLHDLHDLIENPTLSPDGSKIAFSVGGLARIPEEQPPPFPELYVINSDGTNLNQLTNNNAIDWQPAWSPN